MVPLVSHVNELKLAKGDILSVAKEVAKEHKTKMKYLIGTMIELPRAALTADEIAREAEFFSYGTNDLTQTTFGFSRDDIEGKFLPVYIDKKILAHNPFAVLTEVMTHQTVIILNRTGYVFGHHVKLTTRTENLSATHLVFARMTTTTCFGCDIEIIRTYFSYVAVIAIFVLEIAVMIIRTTMTINTTFLLGHTYIQDTDAGAELARPKWPPRLRLNLGNCLLVYFKIGNGNIIAG